MGYITLFYAVWFVILYDRPWINVIEEYVKPAQQWGKSFDIIIEDEGVAHADYMTGLDKTYKKSNYQRETWSVYSSTSLESKEGDAGCDQFPDIEATPEVQEEEEGRPLLFQKPNNRAKY